MTAVIARRHHYVPQCYLRGFVLDRDRPQLFVIDGKKQSSFRTTPANLAAKRDFHRIEVDGYPPDALENAFSGFEAEVSKALDRIITTRSINNDNDRAHLLNLMALIAIKNPRHRDSWRTAQEQLWKRVFDLATATPERWASQIRRAKADGYIDVNADEDYRRAREFVEADQYMITVPTDRHLELEMKAFDTVLPLFLSPKLGALTSSRWGDRFRHFRSPGLSNVVGPQSTRKVSPSRTCPKENPNSLSDLE
jgi:hypothetical protein